LAPAFLARCDPGRHRLRACARGSPVGAGFQDALKFFVTGCTLSACRRARRAVSFGVSRSRAGLVDQARALRLFGLRSLVDHILADSEPGLRSLVDQTRQDRDRVGSSSSRSLIGAPPFLAVIAELTRLLGRLGPDPMLPENPSSIITWRLRRTHDRLVLSGEFGGDRRFEPSPRSRDVNAGVLAEARMTGRRRNNPRRTRRSSTPRSQRSPSRGGRQRTPSASTQLGGSKSTDQPATTPDPDPYLVAPDGHNPADWHIPPVVASRFGLPVRFPALWADEPLNDTFLSNLRPVELWEVLFATLWRLAKQKDQKWTKRIEYEIDYRLFTARKNTKGLVGDLLALKRVPTGRPPGSGGIASLGNSLPQLRDRLLFAIGQGRTRERGYRPIAMASLEDWWEEWRDVKDFPIRHFPKAEIQRELDAKNSPAEIADLLLAHAFGVSPDSVRAHLKKALRRIPVEVKALLGLSRRPRKLR
jgi:hypothetical protein